MAYTLNQCIFHKEQGPGTGSMAQHHGMPTHMFLTLVTSPHHIPFPQLGDSGVEYDLTEIPQSVRSSIAVYEAARALVGYITPDFDEVQRVCVEGDL